MLDASESGWFPRYRRYLLFYVFEKGVVHLIDVVDGKSDYDVEDSR